jgi:hypothetical protein
MFIITKTGRLQKNMLESAVEINGNWSIIVEEVGGGFAWTVS